MSLLSYLNARKGEFLLVLISTWAVACVAMNGFFLDGVAESYGYFTRLLFGFGLTLVLCLVLYLTAGMKSGKALGAVMFVVVAGIMVFLALGASGGDNLYDDAEGNYLYLVLIPIVTTLAGFLLTRTLTGSLVWFVAAAFTCSLIQAFYLCEEVPLSCVATMSAVAVIIYRNFGAGLKGVQLSDGKVSHFALPVSLCAVLVIGGVSLGLWFGVIAPLNPGVLDVKLVTEYKRLPIEEYKGTAQEYPVLNYDLTSDQLIDGEYYTSDELLIDENSPVEIPAVNVPEEVDTETAPGVSGTGSGGSSGGGEEQEPDPDEDDQVFDTFSYMETFPWALVYTLIALLIILLIALYFILRRRYRVRRLRKWLNEQPKDQIILIYRFLISRLRRLGFSPAEGMTLREFAHTSARSMDMITEDTQVSFEQLTETYIAVVYGHYEPTEDDVVPFVSYYLRFWKAARNYLGRMRYFFKAFRL